MTSEQRAGALLSVNVGMPRDVTWHGRTVHTAVWKKPVAGPRMVRRLNIDGDGQGDLAGHGGEQRAVFVYQIESYRYWQEQLGRDDFSYGQFGENFTVQGLADDGQAAGNAGLAEASPPPAWPGFRPLAVTGIGRESETVISVHLADPGGGSVPAALPGQFLTLRLHPDPARRPLLRSYSLSGSPGAPGYRISVKREPRGAASQFLHARVRAGDLLEAAAPRGTFTLRPGQAPVLLISAGVGATPVLAMLHALAAARSTRDIWWLHGARRRADEPFAAESRALLAALPRAHRHICYSSPGPGDVQGRDYDTAGRLSAPVLAALDLPRDADAYLCGPPAFMAGISAALAAAGLQAARIRTEVFGAGPAQTPGIAPAAARRPHPPAGQPGSGPLVAFARSDLTARWDPGYASLLEFAEACDVPVRWSCRTGVCHTCETAVISGTVRYAPAPVDDPADGSALICCSQPRDDLVLDL